ncbi:MAG: type III-B CRISPR module RAMP protein Cmr6 [Chloroflexi bacterium CFX4]|nr:type III-B CRISPR module RAMP protein Cmr6 [Chloroflexi bacterium CFX4]MDL1924117.1 type III-B CRISPR module RAMP protein Cmr6 [Chloroflexi bacterium CFX3]
MSYTYLVPKDAAKLIHQHAAKCQNFGLQLGRYAPQEVIEQTDRLDDRDKVIGKERGFWLCDLCKNFKPDEALIKSTYQRWRAMTEGGARFKATLQGRLVVGLGGKGALEFGITLHRVTGLPYIPGSALKGLTRNYFLLWLAEQSGTSLNLDKFDELLSEAEPEEVFEALPKLDREHITLYRKMFGSQGEAGTCVFHDAVLVEAPPRRLFTVDVMTPHFVKYYRDSGKQAPDDSDSPNPVSYITVSEGVCFAFAISKRRTTGELHLGDARHMLREALNMLGVGAKTAAGYGVFEAAPES